MDLYNPLTHESIGYISNLFYFRGHRYYLCSLDNPLKVPSIVADSRGFPLGLLIHFGSIVVCLSCRDLLDSNKDYSQLIPTDPTTRSYLQKTCYIECNGFYGTGVLISNSKIMTAKHIIPEYCRMVEQIVKIGIYPFTKTV